MRKFISTCAGTGGSLREEAVRAKKADSACRELLSVTASGDEQAFAARETGLVTFGVAITNLCVQAYRPATRASIETIGKTRMITVTGYDRSLRQCRISKSCEWFSFCFVRAIEEDAPAETLIFIVDYIFTVYTVIITYMNLSVFGSYGPRSMEAFPLRQRNFAYARLSLLQALVKALRKSTFADIRVRDLCIAAEVSEPSFYNYFKEKDDILGYFVAFWGIELELATAHSKAGLAGLSAGFAHTARTAVAHPQLMKELLAYQARTDVPQRLRKLRPLSMAEKTLAFGTAPGLEKISPLGIRDWLARNVAVAIAKNELPKHTEVPSATIAFGAVFFGVAGLSAANEFKKLPALYAQTLQIVISGLRKRLR